MSSRIPVNISSTQEFDDALLRASQRALRFEVEIKDLESKLSTSLSNSRALSALLSSSSTSLATSTRRADRAATQHIPSTLSAIERVTEELYHLKKELPLVREQVSLVKNCYDSGKMRARELISSLTFLNTPFFTRILIVVFGPSPVSARRTLLFRTLFVLFVLFSAWAAWLVLASIVHERRMGRL